MDHIIWYIWKAMNDKLFRGIERDPLETVRHAESEFQAWFDAVFLNPDRTGGRTGLNHEPKIIRVGLMIKPN